MVRSLVSSKVMWVESARKALLPFGLLVVMVAMVFALLLFLASKPAKAQTVIVVTFTVNKSGDASDRNIGDGRCDTSRERGRQCTLRGAIQEANTNNTSRPDFINFNIGGTTSVKTISPTSPLPEITESVIIDGYSQRGAKENTLAQGNDAVIKVQLNGTNAGADADGLVIEAANSTIEGLVINRFDGNGVFIAGPEATGNLVVGNFIGTNAAGSTDLGNGDDGVEISNAPDNTIGGTAAGQRNVISGNGFGGIFIAGSEATGNNVEGNVIGTNADGTEDLGNTRDGVEIRAPDNTIGGTAAGARNVISGNEGDGVFVNSGTGNKVEGNFIGTDATGMVTDPDGTPNSGDELGNGDTGVLIAAAANSVGGTAAGAGNVISGNGSDGVFILDATATVVQGNFIGTNADGTGDLGNSDEGVTISISSNNTIGGTAAGARNVISGNGGNGILIGPSLESTFVTGNSVLSNRIFANGGLGIDLDPIGVTDNDPLADKDSDTGANNLQNFPTITSAIRSNSLDHTVISGTLNSNPQKEFTVQCFVADDDPSNHGEGQSLLAQDTTVSTDTNGNASFSCVTPTNAVGQEVSATATNEETGDTSEFSLNVEVRPGA